MKPPEWVFDLSADKQQENVERKIVESVSRVGKLREDLNQELFLLAWLRKIQENGSLKGCSSLDVDSAETDSERQNHVEGGPEDELEEVFKGELEVPNTDNSTEPGKAEQPPKFSADSVSSKDSKGSFTSTSEGSPSSSDYHTAGQNSPANLTEESIPLAEPRRTRLVHKVGSNDSLVAREVSQRVQNIRKYKSCDNLSEDSNAASAANEKQPVGKHRRRNSVPSLRLRPQHGDKIKRRLLSSPCTNLAVGSVANTNGGVDSRPLEEPLQPNKYHNKRRSTTSSIEGVVFREKLVRRPSYTMNDEEALSQWKGSGGATALAVKRSSNGTFDSYEEYNFMVNNDEDSDPALINVLASRMRGSLRTPRTSVSTPEVSNGEGGIVSPSDDHPHTPVPNMEAVFQDSAERIAPLRKRSSTNESSPKKGDSYHYSDDECLTPKVMSGSHGIFSSPSGSNNCSHRNSRSSNGILDEESLCDMTLRKKESRDTQIGRKNTITPENAGNRHSREHLASDEESSLTATLTSREFGGGRADDPILTSDMSIFEKSDSYTELGSLDIDIESTLSKLRDKPEMSMATLLDMNENESMNARSQFYKDFTPDDLEESIEIDEATISAFTLSNDLYGSRSNSASSIPGLFSDNSGMSMSPPEPESPTHSAHQGVNLRPSGGGKRSKNRKGRIDLELMTGGGSAGSDNEEKRLSRSSTSLTSEEESVPISPLVRIRTPPQ